MHYRLPAVPTKIFLAALLWLVLITVLHVKLNPKNEASRVFRIGYMPVYCSLAIPILDHLSRSGQDIHIEALQFSSFAEMAESYKHNHIQAAFIIAPLAIVMKTQGTPLRVVYMGIRNESSFVVQSVGQIQDIRDLAGKTVAVPLRFSGHYLYLQRLLRRAELPESFLHIVELQPPDMAVALQQGAIDAYCVGEPFARQSIVTGEASLFAALETDWPGFITNMLIVRPELIEQEPDLLRKIIHGMVRAGYWAEHNPEAAGKVLSAFWHRDPLSIKDGFEQLALRLDFDHFQPTAADLNVLIDEMIKSGLLSAEYSMTGLLDSTFCNSIDTTSLSLSTILP
jgi:NitT/TauT family transport system substrate-binding protein